MLAATLALAFTWLMLAATLALARLASAMVTSWRPQSIGGLLKFTVTAGLTACDAEENKAKHRDRQPAYHTRERLHNARQHDLRVGAEVWAVVGVQQ